MKRITMTRVCRNESGTWGVLLYNNQPFAVTGEREDLCNIRNESCIPDGEYICERITRPNGQVVFRIMNVPGRSDILFHLGNIPGDDSEGCVIVAESFNLLGRHQAVTDSRHGFVEFMDLLNGDDRFHLTIRTAA